MTEGIDEGKNRCPSQDSSSTQLAQMSKKNRAKDESRRRHKFGSEGFFEGQIMGPNIQRRGIGQSPPLLLGLLALRSGLKPKQEDLS